MSSGLLTDREKLQPYLADLGKAASEYGESFPVICAIGFRESDVTWGKGYSPKGDIWGLHADGHGHGIFGIDDRWHPEFCGGGDHSPLAQARYACKQLRDARGYLKSLFSMPGVDDETWQRVIIAAYNAGPSAARRGLVIKGDPDALTKGGNYSRWVMGKAKDLLIQIPELAHGPVPGTR